MRFEYRVVVTKHRIGNCNIKQFYLPQRRRVVFSFWSKCWKYKKWIEHETLYPTIEQAWNFCDKWDKPYYKEIYIFGYRIKLWKVYE